MQLRVATANTASGREAGTGRPALHRWAGRAAGLGVDVLALQEVDHRLPRSGRADQVAVVAAAMAGDGPAWHARFAAAVHGTPGAVDTMRPAPRTDPREPSYGVGLLSRWPVREWRELRMSPSRARLPVPLPPRPDTRRPQVLWVPDEQRVALAAVAQTPGGEVTAVCTHLSFSPVRAATQLRELVDWARELPRPLVLLGDLNLPGAWPARVTGWRAAVREATFPADRPRVQLDHVLLDPGPAHLDVLDAGAVLVGGDHRALRVELALGRSVHDPTGRG